MESKNKNHSDEPRDRTGIKMQTLENGLEDMGRGWGEM